MTDIHVTDDLKTCLSLRHRVFVVEQGVPEDLEQDALDATATHLLALSKGEPLGTARLVQDGDTVKIGRVCVLPAARGTGIGAQLIRFAVDHARTLPGVTRAKLGAQVSAIAFYQGLGFRAYGPVYDDAGIDHQDMDRAL